MKIGIIGAGHIGGTLTRRFSAVGHEVSVANSRGPQTLSELARETGASAVSLQDAPRDADVVVITIPMKSVPGLPEGLLDRAPDAVVIDTCNYYPQRDGRIAPIEEGVAESRWVAQEVGRPVIKAFNNIYAQHLLENGLPEGAEGRIALPVAGDDPRSKAVVMDLVEEIGFDAVDAGSLDESWRQQPGTPVYAADLDRDGVARALAEASAERPLEFRAA